MPRDGTLTEARVELEPWRRTLLEAAKIVRERWDQGGETMLVDNSHACALKAICLADGSVPSHDTSMGRMYSYYEVGTLYATQRLASHLGLGNEQDIWEWNDEDGRTAEEVATVMESVALGKLREREGA